MTADILFERRGAAGVVTLNRPKALNAVSHAMVLAFRAQLEAWADDSAITRVVITAAGERAFSAGGDIRALYDRGKAGRHAEALQFWADEYPLNTLIKNYRKTYVALIDGIAMYFIRYSERRNISHCRRIGFGEIGHGSFHYAIALTTGKNFKR